MDMRPASSVRSACKPASRPLRYSAISLFAVGAILAGCSSAPPSPKVATAQASTPSPLPTLSAADAPLPPEKTGGFDAARAYAHVARLVEIGPRPPASEGIRRAQTYIRGELRAYGCAVEEDDFTASTPIGKVAMKNIVAKVPGTGRGVVLLLTHYDTLRMPGFVGANDGGSSTGVLLEMARVLCNVSSQKTARALSFWIAFLDGEEAQESWSDTDSVYGSRELAARLANSGDLARVKAVLLADIVGNRELKVMRESNSTAWLTDLVWTIAARLGYSKIFVKEVADIQDDHLPFVRRKVPAVDLIAGDYVGHPPWHTTEDTLDKISPRSLGVIGHVLVETVTRLDKKFR